MTLYGAAFTGRPPRFLHEGGTVVPAGRLAWGQLRGSPPANRRPDRRDYGGAALSYRGRSALRTAPLEEATAATLRRDVASVKSRLQFQAYSKVFFQYGRRVGGGVGQLRLAGGVCQCVVVGGLLELAGRMRGVLSACARGGPPGVAHRAGAFGATPALSRTAGRGRRQGPPVAGRRSAGWRGGGIRTGPRSARWRWPRWSGRPGCAAGCRHGPGSGPRRR